MKILITGGCGFIGSALVRMAVERGHSVINVDALTYAANPDNLVEIADSPLYQFEHANIGDADAMQRIFAAHRPAAVMHLAAESHVDRSIDGPLEFVNTNVTGTAVLLQACREYLQTLSTDHADQFRFVHVSTDEVYGSLGDTGAFTEDSPYKPNSPYAASKASADMLVRAWFETYGFPAIITNCSNNYGPYQFPEKLIPVVTLRALAGKSIPVYGRGLNVRDWLHVDDHVDALLAVLERGRLGETYNIGGNAERSNIELVNAICEQLDGTQVAAAPHSDLIEYVTDRPGHDFRYAIDASKIRDELGWTPSVRLKDGLHDTVDWYVENAEWCRNALERSTGKPALERLGLGVS
jgi:dTDP-glucose 4,6-dehydratase